MTSYLHCTGYQPHITEPYRPTTAVNSKSLPLRFDQSATSIKTRSLADGKVDDVTVREELPEDRSSTGRHPTTVRCGGDERFKSRNDVITATDNNLICRVGTARVKRLRPTTVTSSNHYLMTSSPTSETQLQKICKLDHMMTTQLLIG